MNVSSNDMKVEGLKGIDKQERKRTRNVKGKRKVPHEKEIII